ncbi:MAG TPA: DUF3187 family protein [Gemmatimonadales bacterium]|nr:DUF3187 family protein [Gemmatimonadales bacterium]
MRIADACLILIGTRVALSMSALQAQSLPLLHEMNPVAEARSGLYFQPYVAPSAGWHVAFGLDYASLIELNLRQSTSDTSYLFDAEALRFNVSLTHDIGRSTFVTAEAFLGGTYNGFLDGFMNWYHGLFGIQYPERRGRPLNSFAYYYEFPGGRVVHFPRHDAYLGDLRLGVGRRWDDQIQSVLSVTLPTNSAGGGYARENVSVSLLNTIRVPLTPRLVYEGSFNTGVTPTGGPLGSIEENLFFLGTSGARWRTVGSLWSFANLYLHSPYYQPAAQAGQLDGWDLTIDFGWIIRSRRGHEFRFGMTEDLKPGGPAIDADFRLGYAW